MSLPTGLPVHRHDNPTRRGHVATPTHDEAAWAGAVQLHPGHVVVDWDDPDAEVRTWESVAELQVAPRRRRVAARGGRAA